MEDSEKTMNTGSLRLLTSDSASGDAFANVKMNKSSYAPVALARKLAKVELIIRMAILLPNARNVKNKKICYFSAIFLLQGYLAKHGRHVCPFFAFLPDVHTSCLVCFITGGKTPVPREGQGYCIFPLLFRRYLFQNDKISVIEQKFLYPHT